MSGISEKENCSHVTNYCSKLKQVSKCDSIPTFHYFGGLPHKTNISSGNSYREGIISLKSSPGGQSFSFNTIGSPSSVLRRPNLKYQQVSFLIVVQLRIQRTKIKKSSSQFKIMFIPQLFMQNQRHTSSSDTRVGYHCHDKHVTAGDIRQTSSLYRFPAQALPTIQLRNRFVFEAKSS